jgi:hypothetical protein
LREDKRFHEYLCRPSETDQAPIGDAAARLAFWINAYSALTIQGFLTTLAVDRKDWPKYRIDKYKANGKSFWEGLQFQVGEKWYTLDEIEHGVLRSTSGLRDPRIHLALVCAAKGCPPLANRAYTAEGIEDQLADRVRRFVADPSRCRFDRGRRIIYRARIFDWYGEDFTNPEFEPRAASVPAFLSSYVADESLARSLKEDSWQLAFVEYDWHLNIQP